jgi:hypothetical protein
MPCFQPNLDLSSFSFLNRHLIREESLNSPVLGSGGGSENQIHQFRVRHGVMRKMKKCPELFRADHFNTQGKKFYFL